MSDTSVIGRFKLFSDPVHGFVSVPKDLILDLVQTPEVQRLRRIRQLGVGHMVFPGAEHSRFGHALGAMALMHDALVSLREKGTELTAEDVQAALIAALLHDVGHGPFSHTLEHSLLSGTRHEDLSRALILRLNNRFDGALSRALAIFDGECGTNLPPAWLHSLLSSQLDMDRLDYLRRDSYYTGVVEGSVGVGRIIRTLRVVHDDRLGRNRLVVEAKGRYAVENFLLSRRLMYWQVYLHKTVLSGDFLLKSIIGRVRDHLGGALGQEGVDVAAGASTRFLFFLDSDFGAGDLTTSAVLSAFVDLDDTDIIFSLKAWCTARDPVLAHLCQRFLTRDFFRVSFLDEDDDVPAAHELRDQVASWLRANGITDSERNVAHFLGTETTRHEAYSTDRDGIGILRRDGQVEELADVAGSVMQLDTWARKERSWVCCPKEALSRS